MTMRAHMLTRAAAVAVVVAVSIACNKPSGEPLKITAVDLGSGVTDDKMVHSPAETFAPKSTIYASIATDGVGSGTLSARWTAADGKLLAEQKQTINPTKATHFEFHYAPAEGWPVGRHKVVLALDGSAPRTREFDVR